MSYAIVDGEVRHGGMLVDRAHAPSFMPLGWAWAKDKAAVYAHGVRVHEAAPASFVALDAIYGRDRERVFGGERALEADPSSFRVLGAGYAHDNRHAFYGEWRDFVTACWTLETADTKTFAVRAHRWAIDATHAYCAGMVVAEANPARLVPLSARLAVDGERVFAGHFAFEDAEPEGFRALDDHYAIDASRVFHGEQLARVVAAADRATFRPIGHDFAIDRRYAFWEAEVIAGVSPAGLRAISPRFTATSQVQYWYSGIHGTKKLAGALYGVKPIVLEGADPDTFRDHGELYGGDAKRVWYHSSNVALRGAARRFEVIGARLARDDKAVYYETDVVPGAKPATFAIVAPAGVARDGARWYRYDAFGEYPMIQRCTADEARAVLDGEADDPYEGYEE